MFQNITYIDALYSEMWFSQTNLLRMSLCVGVLWIYMDDCPAFQACLHLSPPVVRGVIVKFEFAPFGSSGASGPVPCRWSVHRLTWGPFLHSRYGKTPCHNTPCHLINLYYFNCIEKDRPIAQVHSCTIVALVSPFSLIRNYLNYVQYIIHKVICTRDTYEQDVVSELCWD